MKLINVTLTFTAKLPFLIHRAATKRWLVYSSAPRKIESKVKKDRMDLEIGFQSVLQDLGPHYPEARRTSNAAVAVDDLLLCHSNRKREITIAITVRKLFIRPDRVFVCVTFSSEKRVTRARSYNRTGTIRDGALPDWANQQPTQWVKASPSSVGCRRRLAVRLSIGVKEIDKSRSSRRRGFGAIEP